MASRFSLLPIWLTVVALILALSCTSNNSASNPPDTSSPEENELPNITAVQSSTDSLVQKALTTSKDTAAALAAIVDKLNSDTLVDTAIASEQGIAIYYENGMRGGIFLSPMDDTAEGVTVPAVDMKLEKSTTTAVDSPLPKQAVLWVVHYNERVQEANRIAAYYDKFLPKAGYSVSKNYGTVYLNDLCSLSTKQYIHLYSHGWAWPKPSAITDVYLMTNETVTPAIMAQYSDDFKTGRIITASYHHANICFVNAEFITRHNIFKGERFFYGGFCFSFLGKWPDALSSAGVSAYTGFTWSVYTNYNAWWARTIAYYMADTVYPKPMTLGFWYDTMATIKKFYHNDEAKKDVYIHYTGSALYTLWDRLRIDSLTPERGGPGTTVTITGLGFGALQESAGVTFNGGVATVKTWSDSVITATVPSSASSGPVVVKRDGLSSNGVRFTIGGPFISAITPDTTHANDSVVVTGEKFGKGGKVLFDTIEANVIGARWDSTRIAVWVPVKATSGLIRVLARRENEYNKYDTSNAVRYTIAVPKPVIAAVTPCFALPDSFNYLKISGSWWRRSPVPNSFVTIGAISITPDYWTYDTMKVRCSPSIPLGMQQIRVVDDSVASEPADVYFGIPIDTLAKTARYARCEFVFLAQCADPQGAISTMAITPGTSVSFSPVTWNDRDFSFDYTTPGKDIQVKITGRIGTYGTTIASINADYTRTNGDHAVITLAAEKEIPLQQFYRQNFTNQFTWTTGFQPPPYSILRDSIPGYLNATGTLHAMDVVYTIQSITNQGIPSFSLEFKRTAE